MLQWLEDNGSDVRAVTVMTALAPCCGSRVWVGLRLRRGRAERQIGSASSRPGSPRGLLATRDVAAGEVVLSIPVKLALSMGTMTSTTAAEAAVKLLREKVGEVRGVGLSHGEGEDS
jgi:hypothetical protein